MDRELKADRDAWIEATANLNKRRGASNMLHKATAPHSTYTEYIEACGYGNSVLDVGCGSQTLRLSLPKGVKYYGLDAFPINGVDCIECAIEDLKGWEVDTCFAFAVLDNCRDFFKACEVMKQTAQRNIGIVTGVNIEVDEFHTFKLQLSDFDKAFEGWKCTVRKELQPNVWLLNYVKI